MQGSFVMTSPAKVGKSGWRQRVPLIRTWPTHFWCGLRLSSGPSYEDASKAAGLGFRVQGFGFKVYCRARVRDSGSRVSRLRLFGLGLGIEGCGSQAASCSHAHFNVFLSHA